MTNDVVHVDRTAVVVSSSSFAIKTCHSSVRNAGHRPTMAATTAVRFRGGIDCTAALYAKTAGLASRSTFNDDNMDFNASKASLLSLLLWMLWLFAWLAWYELVLAFEDGDDDDGDDDDSDDEDDGDDDCCR